MRKDHFTWKIEYPAKITFAAGGGQHIRAVGTIGRLHDVQIHPITGHRLVVPPYRFSMAR